MRSYLKALPLVLLISTPFTFANVEGTYAGQSKSRIHLWSYEDSDIIQYQLVFTNAFGDSPNAFQSPSAGEIELGKTYTFKQNGSRYDDSQPSQCIIKATFDETGLSIKTQNGCSEYTGQYAFSKKSTFLPEEYQGRWSKTAACETIAIIDKTWFALDADYGSAFVVNITDGDNQSHDVVGLEYYEDFYGDASVNFKRVGDKLHIKGDHHAIKYDDLFVRCQDKAY